YKRQIAVSDWVLLAKADSTIALNSLDQAGAYRIGGYRNDAISQFLIDRGGAGQNSLQDKDCLF
ncbi:hypothetical protein ACQ4LH_21775, partial [Pseudomonas peli]